MILNAWSVTTGFLAAVGLLLASASLVAAGNALIRTRSRAEPTELDAQADRARLAFLIGGTLLIVRLLGWPLFYGTLASFVPELATQGVMCAFGVTQIDPARVHALEVAKPLGIALLGAGWLLTGAVRGSGQWAEVAVVRRARLILLAIASSVLVVECVLELAWLLADKGGRAVTCCSTFFGSEAARVDASIGPLSGLRGLGDGPELALWFGTGLIAIVGALWLRRAARPPAALALVALGLFALAQIPVALQVWIDVVAPRVLGLPYHHCPYELVTETLALGPAAVFGVLGRAALALPTFAALLFGDAHGSAGALQATRRRALGLGALWLGSELVLTAAHMV